MSKQFTGTVVSSKMNKTAVVRVEWKIQHPVYRKVLKKRKNYMVRYDNMEVRDGDIVTIEETRPIAKNVHFRIISKAQSPNK